MNITMSDTRTYTIPELTLLLASLDGVNFQAESKAEAYDCQRNLEMSGFLQFRNVRLEA